MFLINSFQRVYSKVSDNKIKGTLGDLPMRDSIVVMLHFGIRQLNSLVKSSLDGLDSKRNRAMYLWNCHLAQWKNVTHSKQISSEFGAPTGSNGYIYFIFQVPAVNILGKNRMKYSDICGSDSSYFIFLHGRIGLEKKHGV